MRRRLVVLLIAIGLDLLWGDLPNRLHPVAGLGRCVAFGERRLPRRTRAQRLLSGLALAVVAPVVTALVALAPVRGLRRLSAGLGLVAEGFVLKQTFAVRGLFDHCEAVERPLLSGDLEAARAAVSRMVSRDTTQLSESLVASAAIESIAENASDSAVAPWLWYAVGGLPFAAAYRAVNTLDAMVGYREKGLFGMPSARLDDAANLGPARFTALALALVGSRPVAVARGTLRDHGATPSPNSGWPMAAAAYALDVRLEKPGHHVLNGEARAPGAMDISRARRIVGPAIALAGLVIAMTFVVRESR